MANMSYCRFQNTVQDLRDCYDALEVSGIDSLSSEEKRAAIRVINLCCSIAYDFGHLTENS